MWGKEHTYNQAAWTLVDLGLCNAPLAESDTGFSFLCVLCTVDGLEVTPINTQRENAYAQHNRKLHAMLVLQHSLPQLSE